MSTSRRPFFEQTNRSEYLIIGKGVYAVRWTYGFAESFPEVELFSETITVCNTISNVEDNPPALSVNNDVWFFLATQAVKPEPKRRIHTKILIWFYAAPLKIATPAADFLVVQIGSFSLINFKEFRSIFWVGTQRVGYLINYYSYKDLTVPERRLHTRIPH